MRLSYRDLKKRDVINVEDGRCLGRIIDLDLNFPSGVLAGIVVPGRKVHFCRIFDKTEIYIDQSRIIKIGGDVILVNINCGDNCSPNSNLKGGGKNHKPKPPCNHCPPPNHCSPNSCPPQNSCSVGNIPTCNQLFGEDSSDGDY